MITAAPRPWTERDDAELRRRYPTETAERLADAFGRSPGAIATRAKRLGIVRNRRWTAAEDDMLRSRYGRVDLSRLAAELGRSEHGVAQRAQKLGLETGHRWNAEEDAILRDRYGSDTAEAIGRDLGRSAGSVIQRANLLGLRHKRRWTPADDDAIRCRYGQEETSRLARDLRRTSSAIAQRARKLGLEHPRNWSPDEDAIIVARYRNEPTSAIAADLPGRSRPAVNQRARDLGLWKADRFFGRGHVWTAADNAYLRQHYGTQTAAAIARRLGRTKHTVHEQARRLGVAGPVTGVAPPDLDDRVREGHAAEHYDHEVARAAGVCAKTVNRRRARLGLRSSTQRRRTREFLERCESVLARTGCASAAEYRWRIEKRRSQLAGWPPGISRQGVEILNVLWSEGPMTRRELAERLGVAWAGTMTLSSDRWGLPGLVRAGLVVSIQRALKIGKSAYANIYMLSLDVDRGPIREEVPA